MNTINFNEVDLNENSNSDRAPRKTVSPGVDIFTIEEAEVKSNTNDKQYIALKFVNAAGQYLKEQFYITTTNALKRVKELATNAGVTLGEETADQVAAKLIGNKVGLIVGADKENAVIDGRETVVTRSRIKNAYNFSFKAAELEKWKDSKITIEDKTVQAATTGVDLPTEATSDLPF